MEILTNKYAIDELSPVKTMLFSDNSLFFDIECVGLSPKKSEVYLIGCASRIANEITITLYFANDLSDEKEVLESFDAHLNDYDTVISFNGTRFDEPFIVERMKRYGLVSSLPQKKHIDLYLASVKNKCVLDLPNYKQKTIEQFLGIYRDDQFNGGELIPIYHKYVSTKDQSLKDLLILHNFEDVKGMIDVIEIMSYDLIVNSKLIVDSIERDNDTIDVVFKSDIYVPKSVSKIRDFGVIIIKDNVIAMSIKVIADTFNTYLDNYRDYVYLINEDIIVPKQLAGSIDKDSKVNAKKENCKVSLSGEFIEIPSHLDIPKSINVFKKDFHDKHTYINVNDLNDDLLTLLIRYILKH